MCFPPLFIFTVKKNSGGKHIFYEIVLYRNFLSEKQKTRFHKIGRTNKKMKDRESTVWSLLLQKLFRKKTKFLPVGKKKTFYNRNVVFPTNQQHTFYNGKI